MKYSPKQLAQALYLAISGTHPKDHDKVMDNFVGLLRELGSLNLMDEIEAEFLRAAWDSRGIKVAEVTSARKLKVEEEKQIVAELNDYVKGFVELKQKVDKGLIGGIVVKIGDEVIDGSVRRQLKELKSKLIT